MKNKVRNIVDEVVIILRTWHNVRAIMLQHFVEKDIYDPNFSISLDVFRDGEIPHREERGALFPQAQYFESAYIKNKDRFIWKDLPVHISYKDCSRVDTTLSEIHADKWRFIERSTYVFHRISTGTIEWCRDDWIHNILKKLDKLPASFWETWIESCNYRIDHLIGNLRAATIKKDPLYFNLSLSFFLKTLAELLFAINHIFEPGIRDYTASLALLELLPDGFEAHWTSLLREDPGLPPERKQEIAEILAKRTFALIP